MEDIYDLVKNIDTVYNSNTSFQVLKDFERVLDELDLYVYKNWEEGELFKGPDISRHWVTCTFMWPKGSMPDPVGGKRLADYDCKIRYIQTHITVPRKIRKPDDMRPYTKKGKLDTMPIWLVEIVMPKKLILDIYSGYREMLDINAEPAQPDAANQAEAEAQPADTAAAEAPAGAV